MSSKRATVLKASSGNFPVSSSMLIYKEMGNKWEHVSLSNGMLILVTAQL